MITARPELPADRRFGANARAHCARRGRRSAGPGRGLQDKCRAFITLTPGAGPRQADQGGRADRPGPQLPLAGVPFAVKDLIDVEGVATTCGSRPSPTARPQADATVVRRLVEAGAVLLGKLNLHECAFGFTGENPTMATARIRGTRSASPAAPAAARRWPWRWASARFTLGSDTGGSIRLPAALCSITRAEADLRPRQPAGRRAAVVDAGPRRPTGPHGRGRGPGAADHGRPGPGRRSPAAGGRCRDYSGRAGKPLRGLRLGVPDEWFFGSLEPAVAKAARQRPSPSSSSWAASGRGRAAAPGGGPRRAPGDHLRRGQRRYHEPFLRERADEYGDDIRPLLEAGLFLPAVDYLQGAARPPRDPRANGPRRSSRSISCVTPASPDHGLALRPADRQAAAGREAAGAGVSRRHAAVQLLRPSGHVDPLRLLARRHAHRPATRRQALRPEAAAAARRRIKYQQATEWHRADGENLK